MTRSEVRRCVVTGGAGFIGSHLVDGLLAEGNEVLVVDNLSTGRASNLSHLDGHPRYSFVKQDVSDLEAMTPIVAGCDELYHLASYVGVKLAATSTSHTILNNLRSIDTILELAGRYRPKFLLTSTSEIYGKALDVLPGESGALTEDAVRVYGPTEVYRWSYAGIKAVEEFLTLAKHREEGLRAVIVRLFNVIGPRQVGRHGPVVPRFIDQALAGEPITIYGDGEQRRCFTYVEDAVRAMLALTKVPVADGEVFNVGGSAPVTMRELAEIILRSTGSAAAPSFVPYAEAFEERFEDVHERIPDTSKLERLTDVRISRSLEDAIERTVAAHPLWIRNAR